MEKVTADMSMSWMDLLPDRTMVVNGLWAMVVNGSMNGYTVWRAGASCTASLAGLCPMSKYTT